LTPVLRSADTAEVTSPAPMPVRSAEPSLLTAVALVSEYADRLVLGTVRDVHRAIAQRVWSVVNPSTAGAARVPQLAHDAISTVVYGSIGVGLGTGTLALRAAAARAERYGAGPRLTGPAGEVVQSAVNGLIGDRLAADASPMAIELGIRLGGRDVLVEREQLAAAYPDATERVAVLIHGLGENDAHWGFRRDQVGTTYADTLTALGWTPVVLRVNTGRSVRENGAALSGLLSDLVDEWPVDVRRIAFVGHSMGGLIARAACAVRPVGPVGPGDPGDPCGGVDRPRPWTSLVSDLVCLGTPHLGADLAAGVTIGSRLLGVLPETAAFSRILDTRSAGIVDLTRGLGVDVAPLPGVHYRLVAATLGRSTRHPLGDLLVRVPSATGRSGRRRALFPDAEVLHLPSTGHFGLLNHPDVHTAMRRWLR